MSSAALRKTVKSIPIVGPVLKAVWRKVVAPARQAYLHTFPETTRRTTYFGRAFDYPSRSIIGRFIENGDEWDGVVLRQISQALPQDAVVVEVGSNIGASTVVIAELLKRSVFLLVEAGERYLPFLRENTAFLGDRVLGIETRAMSDGSVKEVVFNTNSTTGTPSNVDYKADLTARTVVQTATLSESTAALERIDFLKVDTDGYEVEVFGGAADVVAKHQPVIFTEFCVTALRRLHDENQFFAMLARMHCLPLLVFAHSGEYLGIANSVAEIVRLQGVDYYVDLVCTPVGGRYAAALAELAATLPLECRQ